MNRREFILMGTSAAALPSVGMGPDNHSAVCVPQNEPRLKVGILSDVHVTNKTPGKRDSNEYLRKALRYFDAEKVDAVLIAGDLFTHGVTKELEIVAETWFEVFPDDRGSDGRSVERLFITGNHDICGWDYSLVQKGETRSQRAERLKNEIFDFRRREVWDRLFHEEYKPYFLKTVKGYPFLMRNWPSPDDADRCLVREAMSEYGKVMREAKVCFYCQHNQVADTVNAAWMLNGSPKWDDGQDRGPTHEVLADYPNLVALTGHSHHSLADERSIWQGEFTAVNCGCLVGWAFTHPGRENGHDCDSTSAPVREMKEFDFLAVHQGMVMTVYDNCIRFHRREFRLDGVLGPDWIVPIGGTERPYAFASRAAASKPPRFAKDAQVKINEIANGSDRSGDAHPQIEAEFPPVTSATGGDRAQDYSVRVEMRIGEIVRTMDEKRVYSERFMYAEKDETLPVRCCFARYSLPVGRDVRFIVTPYNCWMKPGDPIVSEWFRV